MAKKYGPGERFYRFDVFVFGESEPRVCLLANGIEDAEDEAGQDLGLSPATLYAVMHPLGYGKRKRERESA